MSGWLMKHCPNCTNARSGTRIKRCGHCGLVFCEVCAVDESFCPKGCETSSRKVHAGTYAGVGSVTIGTVEESESDRRQREVAEGEQGLLSAARKGDMGQVRRAIAAGVNVNARDEKGRTPLHLATSHIDVLQLLIANGADPNASANNGSSPLHMAATYGASEAARALLRAGADRFHSNDSGEYPFVIALKQGNPQMLQALLDGLSLQDLVAKFPVNGACFLLLTAAKNGQDEMLKQLLDAGINAAIADANKNSALHFALTASAVELLVAHGADPNMQNVRGCTPVHEAAASGNLAQLTALLKLGGNPVALDAGARQPLFYALQPERSDCAKLLMPLSDMRATDSDGNSLLHFAILGKASASVFQELCARGCLINAANKLQQTPLHLAAQKDNVEIVRILLDRKADTRARNASHHTPLDCANSAAMKDLFKSRTGIRGLLRM